MTENDSDHDLKRSFDALRSKDRREAPDVERMLAVEPAASSARTVLSRRRVGAAAVAAAAAATLVVALWRPGSPASDPRGAAGATHEVADACSDLLATIDRSNSAGLSRLLSLDDTPLPTIRFGL
ncbi:MAG: hypothetical protein AAF957_10760 [Planctomycetota bacterium]